MKLVNPFVIETYQTADVEFFQPYLDKGEWVDTNQLYNEYDEYQKTMNGREMVDHYIKHVSDFDMKLKKFIIKMFREYGVPTKDWRADFFLTKAGGSMPMHVDGMSKVAFLLPLSKNTGPLMCEDADKKYEVTYQTLTILNTQKSHGVAAPTEDRLLFRIAVHDVNFEDLDIYKKLS